MFKVVLLGLAATAAALPLVHDAGKDHEGVSLPIYKPWYNTYSKHIYGSQHDQFSPNYYYFGDRGFSQDKNYDSTNISPFANHHNYFSKYMRPEMMYMNFYKFLDSFHNMRYPYHSNMFEYMSDFMRYPFHNNEHQYDHMYGPYSKEYTYGNMENFQNTDTSYSNDYSNYMYRPYSPEYMYGFTSNYMNYPHNYENNMHDYMYRPYSNEYMHANMKNFQNPFYQFFDKDYKYFNHPEFTNFQNTYLPFHNYKNKFDYSYRPQTSESLHPYSYPYYNNMNDYEHMYRPYSTEYMNFKNQYHPFQNKDESFDHMYRPYFSGYPQNFADMSYPSNNGQGYSYTSWPNYSGYMNFKNAYYPFQNNMHSFDYKYRPYSPEHKYGLMQNYNMRYPFYNKFNGYDNMHGYQNNYMNKQYPFYNNYYGRTNEFPENMDDMRIKRGLPQNVENQQHLRGEQLIRQDGPAVVANDAELLNHQVINVDRPTPRNQVAESGIVEDGRQQVLEGEVVGLPTPQYTRDTVPEHIRNNLNVEPERIVDDRVPEVRRDALLEHQHPAEHQPSEDEHVLKTRGILAYPAPRYYYPHYAGYPYYGTYTHTYPYHPLWYNTYYYKK